MMAQAEISQQASAAKAEQVAPDDGSSYLAIQQQAFFFWCSFLSEILVYGADTLLPKCRLGPSASARGSPASDKTEQLLAALSAIKEFRKNPQPSLVKLFGPRKLTALLCCQ